MTAADRRDATGRSRRVQELERLGTGLLGIGIIATLFMIPAIVAIFLIYFLIFH